jgi:oxygen-independent coproporphyrinogen-3 oxidase
LAGIYIHIPFCKQKCHYCNFYSLATKKYRKELKDAILKEIELRKDYLDENSVDTIYFGGGTPSLLEAGELDEILNTINRHYSIGGDPEITMEANPDDLYPQKIKSLIQTPVNRLSIGVQSFFEEDLNYLNRVHSSGQAETSVKLVQDAGFEQLSIDLIFGIPTLTLENWKKNLEKFYDLNISHLSAYALTVEHGTALAHFIKKEKVIAPDEEVVATHFRLLMKSMKENTFNQYEISNFCKDDRFARHNTSYWKGVPYLGLGPSAHSYDGRSRHWNAANLKTYIHGMESGNAPMEMENLSKSKRYKEYIMLSIRTIWGTGIHFIRTNFGAEYHDSFIRTAEKYMHNGWMYRDKDKFYLSDEGKLFADGITADLFPDGNSG